MLVLRVERLRGVFFLVVTVIRVIWCSSFWMRRCTVHVGVGGMGSVFLLMVIGCGRVIVL